jgi:hypothetical protein
MIHEASSAAGKVVLVLDAGTEAGDRPARKLLRNGYRVAADPDVPAQRARLLARVRDYFGADRLYTVASPTFVAEKVAATHFAMSA